MGKAGRPSIPAEKKKRHGLMVYLTADEAQRVKEGAWRLRVGVSEYIRRALGMEDGDG